MSDPYAVLGVARGASAEEIKRAYRRLAKRLHPDLNPGKPAIEKQFKDVSAAYELLSDAKKRERFDRGEIDAAGNERMRGYRFSDRHAAGDEGVSLDGIFAEFFGRSRRSAGAQPGASGGESPAPSLRLGFLEAALGGKRRVDLPDGRSLDVKIPAGIDSGQKLRLRGAGGRETFVAVEVEPHPLFTRKGRDIHLEVPVTLAEAVLGATITVPTIHGSVAVKVPRGSNSGALLRLKGKGIAGAGSAGDHYAKLLVMLPDPPDPELAAFLERWIRGHAYEVRGKLGAI
ncbi:MAG TPA: DnaJ C-terminal domain-containing protein [Stellaceae bacterium]|nr:DnaJ C-terminal domain-containing protein [Stellaceae bacterium]